MWIYLLQGIGFGFAAASQPGPLQAYLISQALTRGWKRALPGALAPLISDGPIILLSVFVLNQLPGSIQRVLYITGGLFVLYLAHGAYRSWRDYAEDSQLPQGDGRLTVFKAAITNALSPGPYLFWIFGIGPILVRGWNEAPAFGAALLAGFYVTMILCLFALIFGFSAAAKIGPRLNRAMLGLSAVALLVFGSYQLWRGFSAF